MRPSLNLASSSSSSTYQDRDSRHPSPPPNGSGGPAPQMGHRRSAAPLPLPATHAAPGLREDHAQLLRALNDQLHALQPPLADKFDAVLTLFESFKYAEHELKVLLRHHGQHQDVRRLGNQLSAFVGHFAKSLQATDARYRIDPEALQHEHIQACFRGLAACVPGTGQSLLAPAGSTRQHPQLQALTGLLLERAMAVGLPEAVEANDALFGILNAVTRLLKAGLLDAEGAVTELFRQAVPLIHDWLGGDQRQSLLSSHNLGRCAVQVATAIKLKSIDWQTPLPSPPGPTNAPATWGQMLQGCVLRLVAEPVLRRLTAGKGETIALLNVCNTVKDALELRLLSPTDALLLPALGRLVDAIGPLSAEALLGTQGDCRPLANFSNFLRTLGELGAKHPTLLPALPNFTGTCAALVDRVAGSAADAADPDAQSLANLASFIKFCDKQLQATGTSTVTAATSRSDRITPQLSELALRRAATCLLDFVLSYQASAFNHPDALGGLLSGLAYLWRRQLVADSSGLRQFARQLIEQVGQRKPSAWTDKGKATLLPALLAMVDSGMVDEPALQPALAVLVPAATKGRPVSIQELRRESARVGGIEEIVEPLPPLAMTNAPTTSTASTSATGSSSSTSSAIRAIPGDTPIRPVQRPSPGLAAEHGAAGKPKTPARPVRREHDDNDWETPKQAFKPRKLADTLADTEPTVVMRTPTARKGSPPKAEPVAVATSRKEQKQPSKPGKASQQTSKAKGAQGRPQAPRQIKPAQTLVEAIVMGQQPQVRQLFSQAKDWSAEKVILALHAVQTEIVLYENEQINALDHFLTLALGVLNEEERQILSLYFTRNPPMSKAVDDLLIKHSASQAVSRKDGEGKTAAIEQSLAHHSGGEQVRQQTRDDFNALMVAAMHGRTAEVERLLSHPTSSEQVTQQTGDGYNALMFAATHGRTAEVERLLSHPTGSEQVRQKSRPGGTALMIAASQGHTAVVERLLSHPTGSEHVRQQAKDGINALMLATEYGHAAVVEQLLSHSTSSEQVRQQTKDGGTALMIAAAHGQIKIVELLLAHDSSAQQVDMQNIAGETAQVIAELNGHHDIASRIAAWRAARGEARPAPEQ